MPSSIFPITSFAWGTSKWEDYLLVPTPFELLEGVWFKREDQFAPLGYGGVNGAKLRQLIWLVLRELGPHKTELLSGASVKSPQISMSAVVGAYYGLRPRLILGGTRPDSALQHHNVEIASRFGAKFRIEPVGYNPHLQSVVKKETKKHSVVVEYGVTVPHHFAPEGGLGLFEGGGNRVLRQFSELGANQVAGIPKHIQTLYVPAGSCNTLVGVLLGLQKHQHNVRRVVSLGIGPDKCRWVRERLQCLGVSPDNLTHEWEHVSLHDAGFCTYQTEMPAAWAGVEFHPTYEGKLINWLSKNRPFKQDGTECFWIVGSKPSMAVLEKFAITPQQSTLPLLSEC